MANSRNTSGRTSRRTFLAEFAQTRATLIFYETGPRLRASLEDMLAVFGPRPAAVTRELTKLYETAVRGTLDQLAVDGQIRFMPDHDRQSRERIGSIFSEQLFSGPQELREAHAIEALLFLSIAAALTFGIVMPVLLINRRQQLWQGTPLLEQP